MIIRRFEAGVILLGSLAIVSCTASGTQEHSSASATHAAGAAEPAVPSKRFATPEEALARFRAAVEEKDRAGLRTIFGSASEELLSSGDPVADATRLAEAGERMRQSCVLKPVDASTMNVIVGPEQWPFPIPLVHAADGWFFDTAAGKQEILDRRIGENELATIQVCRGYVEGQRDYASEDRDGDEVLEYAQKIASDPGTKNGLYWPTEEGEEASPLGPLIEKAQAEGYHRRSDGQPVPYHGYVFRILTQQGGNVPGGRYDYVINGNMIGGFALVAVPAEWGSSGIMTFVVNQLGRVYQKNLGERSLEIANGMTEYDPDASWTLVTE